MTTTNERILFIIKHFCEGNKSEFARIMEEKPQTVNGWLKRNNGSNVLNKILLKFPTVRPSWLFAGEGEMLKATETESKSIGQVIGAAIGNGIAQSVTGISTAVAAAAYPLGIGGVIGALFGNLIDTEEDITDDEAVEVLKDALEDARKTTKENEELKQEIEYWRQKANNLEYELSKSQTKVG